MGQLYKILLTIDDKESTIRMPFANVTSLKPTIFGKRFLCQLLVLVVTIGNTRSTDPDFALRTWCICRSISGFRYIDEFYLGTSNRSADRSISKLFWCENRA